MSDARAAVLTLLDLEGVREAVDAARDACTQLRWHEALRRRIPEASAESRVRGARASAFLDGAELPVDLVRDLVRGARPWPEHLDPVDLALIKWSCLAGGVLLAQLVPAVRRLPKGLVVALTVGLAIKPLLDAYAKRGLLVRVDGNGSVGQVATRIATAVDAAVAR